MLKRITAAFISALLVITPVTAFGETGVYVQNGHAVVISDTQKKGYAVAASYNSDGVMLGAEVTPLDLQPYSARSIGAYGLGYRDRVFLLGENYAPVEKSYAVPYQGESDIPHKSFKLDSYPHGADLYIDSARHEKDVTGFTLEIPDGMHYYRYEVPCYKNLEFWAQLGDGGESSLSLGLEPELPETDKTLTVNDGRAVNFDEINYGDNLISFREAVEIANGDKAASYTILFDGDVDTVCAGSVNNIDITAQDLIIDGLSGRSKPVKFDFSDTENKHFIVLKPTKNVILCGVRFKNEAFVIRPDDNETENVSYENIRIFECVLENNNVFAFGGACKKAGTGAAVNYKDMYFCGNELINSNCFFSYSGDCDNSVADGIYYCSNMLDERSKLTINCADCNTWYIYGRETESGGLTKPETSDGNTVRNILVSGNIGGRILMSCAVGGNSNNLMENAVIRNNRTDDFNEITVAQNNNVRNSGQELHTSGNAMRNFLIAYNTEEYGDRRPASLASRLYVARSETDALTADSTLYCDNNSMSNFIIYRNTVKGVTRAAVGDTVDTGVEYTDLGENKESSVLPYKIGLDNEAPEGVSYVSKENNTFKELYFFDNSITKPYKKTTFIKKKDVKAYTDRFTYTNAAEGMRYCVIAVKGTPDNYKINSDSLIYINQFTAKGASVEVSAVIPYENYNSPYVVLLTGDDGVIDKPVVLGSADHIHNIVLTSTVAATCIAEGKKIYKCSVCGREYREKIPKTDHKIVTDKAVAPTFKKAGKTAGKHCKYCNKVFTPQKTVPKLGAAKLSKLRKKKNTFTAYWKKVKSVDGYELQYSTNKKFKKAKTVKVKKYSTVKRTVKKLKKGKKYYVRIRAYKIINGKKQTSKWSKSKSIRLK